MVRGLLGRVHLRVSEKCSRESLRKAGRVSVLFLVLGCKHTHETRCNRRQLWSFGRVREGNARNYVHSKPAQLRQSLYSCGKGHLLKDALAGKNETACIDASA